MRPLLVHHVGEMMQELVTYGAAFVHIDQTSIGIDYGIIMMLG